MRRGSQGRGALGPAALRIGALASFLILIIAATADASPLPLPQDEPIDDGRDHYTLFYRHPVNRQLGAQLDAPDQAFRSGRARSPWAFAADLGIGSGQPASSATTRARFHGYYLVDSYVSVRVIDGLEANLNLLFLNPSSSDGYRVSAHLTTGFALHAWWTIWRPRDRPLRLDLFGTDLGWVTLGAGLLLEQVPLEGVTARLSFDTSSLTCTVGGRALWDDDDVLRTEVSTLNGRVGLIWVDWKTGADTPAAANAYYLSAYVDLPLPAGFRLAAETAVRPEHDRWGALGRADYLGRPRPWLDLHAGYQFRWYQQRFGPRERMVQPTIPFSTPQQEDVYVTNSFEYLGISPLHDQWSHTVMLEGRVHVGTHLDVFLQEELWARFATSPGGAVVAYTPDGFRAPGRRTENFYRAGIALFPWQARPHRLNAYVTNKQAQAGLRPFDPVARRFQAGTYWLLELQSFF